MRAANRYNLKINILIFVLKYIRFFYYLCTRYRLNIRKFKTQINESI